MSDPTGTSSLTREDAQRLTELANKAISAAVAAEQTWYPARDRDEDEVRATRAAERDAWSEFIKAVYTFVHSGGA